MNKRFLLGLAVLAAFVTGCPKNQYIVELTPRENTVERKLIFYREDAANTNSSKPAYEQFPPGELAAITSVYAPGATLDKGGQHIATGVFAGALPSDVGGAGSYKNVVTSLGSAGCYLERFRGCDDLLAVS